MIGLPFNPDNCLFVANQASNANQFNANVPDVSNNSNHTVLWDFVDSKLYWVNTLTNIIEREISGATGIQNESYEVYVQSETFEQYYFSVSSTTLDVFANSYLVLPAGTYTFELEFDIYPANAQIEFTPGVLLAGIYTNTTPSVTSADPSDVLVDRRRLFPSFIGSSTYPLNRNTDNFQILNQTVGTGAVTFANQFIVKAEFALEAQIDVNLVAINNIQLRALLVK